MRRKTSPKPEPVIDEEIRAKARLAMQPDSFHRPARCVICDSPSAPNSLEGLCWVCRRLKISAWRDSDSQAASQE